MPAPSAALVTLRPDLAASFEQYDLTMSKQGFIGTRVFTTIDVPVQAGNFGIIPIEQLLTTRTTNRAPGSGYARQQYTLKPSTFATKEHGAEEPIDDRERAMYQNYLAAEQYAALRARDVVMRNYEIRVVTALTDTSSTFTGALTGTVAVSWKTIASSTPAVDIVKAISAVYANSGLPANTAVIGWNAWQNLRQSADLINRIKYWGGDDPTTRGLSSDVLARYFDLDSVIIAGAQKNTANEGQAASISQVWPDDKIFVGVVDSSSDFKRPCVGRTFHWAADGSAIGGAVESYRDERVRGDVVRVRMDTDENLLYKQCGYVLTGANA